MLQDGDKTGFWHLIEGSMRLAFIHNERWINLISIPCRAATMLGNIPWFVQFAKCIPGVGEDLKAFRAFGISQATIRRDAGSKYKDLFYYLVRCFPCLFTSLDLRYCCLGWWRRCWKETRPIFRICFRRGFSHRCRWAVVTASLRALYWKVLFRVWYDGYSPVLSLLLSPGKPRQIYATSNWGR